MLYFFSVAAGLILGSFANVCIWRLPQEKSLAFPSSHCPSCKKPLRWRDNIPLLGFLLLKGRCFNCRKPISPQYPLVELALALAYALSAWLFYPDIYRILLIDTLIFYFLTISIIDFHHKIIPDELSLSLLAIGLLTSFRNPYLGGHGLPPILESLAASVAGGALMLFFAWGGEKIFRQEALGGGDIKLMAAFGATLGWSGLLGSLVIGSFFGALWGGTLLLLKRKKPADTMPYGPFLCMGGLVSCLYPSWWIPFLSP